MKSLLQHKKVAKVIQKMPTVKQLFFSALGVVLLTFLLLALLSYHPDDPAWSHFGGNEQTVNIAGRLGAWVADILRVFFGLGAWWLMVVITYELMCLWWQRASVAWQLRMMAYGVLLVFISAFLASWTTDAQAALYIGGVFGFELYSGLAHYMGSILPKLLLSALLLLIATLTFNIRWQAIFYQLFSYFLPNSGQTDDDKTKRTEEMPETTTSQDAPSEQTQTSLHIIEHSALENQPTPQYHHDHALEEFLQLSGIKEAVRTQQYADITSSTPDNNDDAAAPTPRHHNKTVDIYSSNDTHHSSITHDTDSKRSSTIIVAPISAPNQPDSDSAASLTHEHSSAQQPQTHHNNTAQPSQPKSRAMDTLAYRMSLSPIPELSLLDPPSPKKQVYSQAQLHQLSELLEIKLKEFGIDGTVVHATVGPVITRFEVSLAAGIKASRVTKITQDLARSMSMTSLRVLPVIAGKPYIGIEVPNRQRQVVGLIELLDTPEYKETKEGIALAIGVNITGKPIIADLAKAPHMLVAGTTGSGKSVLVNSFLLSMLLKYTPDELKLVLIDPKQLELANYADIPHLLTPVITDMTEATAVLNWCVNEMERRYQLMSLLRVRKLSEFNETIALAEQSGEPLFDPLWNPSESVSVSSAPKLKPLPQIVVVADEFADMIMQLGKTAEEPIVRLAQKSRAAGIHLILATQRPVANVVTGLIKSNIPSRVALRVNSATDSRIIIEESGAENMLGHGDMMCIAPGENFAERMHGAYVKNSEINRITDAWRERGRPDYIDLSEHSYTQEPTNNTSEDEHYQAAISFILESKNVSTSSLQRQFGIGYNRAAKLMDALERNGVVSKPDSGGKRQLLL